MEIRPDGHLASAELYDPATGTWTATGSLATARVRSHRDVAAQRQGARRGRAYNLPAIASAELYDVGLGFSSDWQPKIAQPETTDGKRLLLTGSLFQGISQASGGNTQDSSSNYPIVQLRSIDNSQVAFLPVDPVGGWSDTSFTSRPVRDFPFGPAW